MMEMINHREMVTNNLFEELKTIMQKLSIERERNYEGEFVNINVSSIRAYKTLTNTLGTMLTMGNIDFYIEKNETNQNLIRFLVEKIDKEIIEISKLSKLLLAQEEYKLHRDTVVSFDNLASIHRKIEWFLR